MPCIAEINGSLEIHDRMPPLKRIILFLLSLRIELQNGRQFTSGASWSRTEIEEVKEQVALFLGQFPGLFLREANERESASAP